ncbi:unnamed protein product [Lasius platythorax]|uniref:Uncharacterized protein n=1 Tax=Lasius platythorax TaxID=488582 RepID=A0AAV2NCK8_9HYME
MQRPTGLDDDIEQRENNLKGIDSRSYASSYANLNMFRASGHGGTSCRRLEWSNMVSGWNEIPIAVSDTYGNCREK